MKHKCNGCGNNLFEIIPDKKHNEVWIVCSKCKRNSEIIIPMDKDELEKLKQDIDLEANDILKDKTIKTMPIFDLLSRVNNKIDIIIDGLKRGLK